VLLGRAAGHGDPQRVVGEHRRGGGGVAEVGVHQRLRGGPHVAAGPAGAVAGDGEGRGVGGRLQPGLLRVQGADVDGDRGEPEDRHHQQRQEHRGAAALAGEPAPEGPQPLHRMTPVPVRSMSAPKKSVRKGIG
jgi:hypothetical protein